ncbi:unnamed protein product [Heterobilharzia americana]|nr:unnamed protein product [Heterobilharzia americana]
MVKENQKVDENSKNNDEMFGWRPKDLRWSTNIVSGKFANQSTGHESENETNLSNEAKTFIKNVQKHNFIRLSFTDLNGMHLSKLLPTRFAKKIAEGKCEMYSGIITFGPRFEVTNIPEIVKKSTVSEPIPCTKYNDMYKTSLLSFYEDFFADVDYNLQIAKIDVQDYSNEDGDGQLECPLMPTWGLSAADNYFIFKQAVKEIGSKHEMEISFMTKPLLNASSSGCHYNHSLWYADSNRNAFFDEKDPDGLSSFARHWIAGLIEHLPAMSAICSPTVNCYRRFHKHLAPSAANWDFHDRFVAIRVKNFDEKRTYVENRIPSSASCSYHVLAATLAAGLDGLERQLQLPPAGLKANKEQTKVHVKLLPGTVHEALQLLKEDKILANKLGEDFVDWFIRVKELGDLSSLSDLNIHDNREETLAFERYEYFNFI